MEGHEPPVRFLGVAVEVDGAFQHFDRGVGGAGAFIELGETEVGVEGAAVQVLADRFDPAVVATSQKVAAVDADGMAKRRASPVAIRGPGRLAKGMLELPKVAGDLRRARLVEVPRSW